MTWSFAMIAIEKSCVSARLTVAPGPSEVNLGGRRTRGRERLPAPPRERPAAARARAARLPARAPPRARGRLGGRPGRAVVAVAVAAKGERRPYLEPALEPASTLLPALLILELVLVERRRLLDPVGEPELDRQLRGASPHLVPRRAERELVGDRADPARVDVAGQGDRRQDRPRPVRGLGVDRHRQDVQVVAAPAVAGDHRAGGPRRGHLAGRRPVALRERQQHRGVLAAVAEALLDR